MKNILLVAVLLCTGVLSAQNPLITREGTTSFFSHAPLEDIEAVNDKTTAAIDFVKGDVVVKMLIKHFTFKNALMQEHFNENYMESEKFPAAIFKGKILTDEAIDLSQDGTYSVRVKGGLTIHGVEQAAEATAMITVTDGQVTAKTEFIARPADYDIEIPTVVVRNIAEEIQVTTTLNFSTTKE
ncbi:YceI family protein [Lewinella sp. W8]|uniref:YceI family protein n=1 Tax=Lewinella sp. W8 TaxID=2528208 RepID=UPI0012B63746|nr:YceI family protein [Lewinella sp. W8]